MKTFKTKVEVLPRIRETLSGKEMYLLATIEINYAKYHSFINCRQEALIMLLANTGCRIGEALSLTRNDFNLGEHKSVIFLKTKNGHEREVYIKDELYELLFNLPHKGKYLFTSGTGQKLSSNDINADLKKRAKKAGIEKNVYPHLFRHSFVTIMLEQGISDSNICVMVGWRDPKVLLRYKNSKPEYFAKIMMANPIMDTGVKVKVNDNADVYKVDLSIDPDSKPDYKPILKYLQV